MLAYFDFGNDVYLVGFEVMGALEPRTPIWPRQGLRFPRSGPVAALWGGKGKLQRFSVSDFANFLFLAIEFFFPVSAFEGALRGGQWGILTGACVWMGCGGGRLTG